MVSQIISCHPYAMLVTRLHIQVVPVSFSPPHLPLQVFVSINLHGEPALRGASLTPCEKLSKAIVFGGEEPTCWRGLQFFFFKRGSTLWGRTYTLSLSPSPTCGSTRKGQWEETTQVLFHSSFQKAAWNKEENNTWKESNKAWVGRQMHRLCQFLKAFWTGQRYSVRHWVGLHCSLRALYTLAIEETQQYSMYLEQWSPKC